MELMVPSSPPPASVSRYWDGVGTLVQYAGVKRASAIQFTPITGATDNFYGVIQNTTALAYAASHPLDVIVQGWTIMKAGGTVTEGKIQEITAAGLCQDATPAYDGSEILIGVAYSSGSSGDFVVVFITKILV